MRQRIHKATRSTAGFTTMEAILSVAILAIVAGLIFVNVNQYLRGLYQREMDETAKEIYVAAQNHLILADNLDTFAGRTLRGAPDRTTAEGTADQAGDQGVYYFVVGGDGTDVDDIDNNRSVLAAMLPRGAIDETVRTGGSYIVRYRYARTGSTVLDVFYADPQGRYPYTFSDGDFAALFSSDTYRGEGGAAARADYNGAIIGYYGGDMDSLSTGDIPTPKLVVRNVEELTATVTNRAEFVGKATLELYVVGKQSGAVSRPFALTAADDTFIIDSVTRSGMHFANLESANAREFVPGEDVEVQAFALSTDSLRMTKSAKRTTNSLFASAGTASAQNVMEALFSLAGAGGTAGGSATRGQAVQGQAEEPQTRYVRIANMRHLLNLDKDVSAYDAAAAAELGADAVYEQVADLSWSSFRKRVAGLAATAAETDKSSAVQVFNIIGQSYGAPGSYRPVNPDEGLGLVYEGYGHYVADVSVPAESGAGEAGLFGLLQGARVSDLELLNFYLAADRDVGGLAGKALNATIENVLVRNEATGGADAALELRSAGGSAGGLVGALEQESTVTDCGAAVYVRTAGQYAGGLLGYVSGTAVVERCYAAGHTSQGRYLETTDAGVAGRVNVVAGRSAGGLVGAPNFANFTVRDSYSTCSVQGSVDAGGLLGWVGNGQVSNCYATGLVLSSSEDGNVGGLVGSAGGASYSNCRYLDMANYGRGVGAAGSGGLAGVSAFDDSADAYNGFATHSARAFPYDGTLETTYPYPTVAALAGQGAQAGESATALTKHLTAHYGDWPLVETLVVNVRG